jgi:hypothetical protein
MPEYAFTDTDTVSGPCYTSVVPSPNGWYLYYLAAFPGNEKILDFLCSVCLAESEDGFNWTKVALNKERKSGFPQVIYPGRPVAMCNCVYYDPYDDEPKRRYKMTDISGIKGNKSKDPFCGLLYSENGIDFEFDEKNPWLRKESDSGNNIIYNIHTKKYQIMHRRHLTERLVYCTESSDLKIWSKPRIIFHPSPIDPSMMQFYGMRQIHYGEMYLGFLWRYQTIDEADPGKMVGKVETELVYSYDGACWQRTYKPFLECMDLGEIGSSSIYGSSMVEINGELIIYAMVTNQEHYFYKEDKTKITRNHVLAGKLRKDGFVSLRSGINAGELITDILYLRDNKLSLNVRAPQGVVKVQICDFLCRPLPGYSYEECEPIQGDFVDISPKWKSKSDLSDAIKMVRNHDFPGRARIAVRLEQAEIFSISGDFGVAFHSNAPGEDTF